ncbi:MAG: hypothetical protein JWR26_533 [Pedosphaera sp.]|nr:hypothetical protein [Pedosphaera sp.]
MGSVARKGPKGRMGPSTALRSSSALRRVPRAGRTGCSRRVPRAGRALCRRKRSSAKRVPVCGPAAQNQDLRDSVLACYVGHHRGRSEAVPVCPALAGIAPQGILFWARERLSHPAGCLHRGCLRTATVLWGTGGCVAGLARGIGLDDGRGWVAALARRRSEVPRAGRALCKRVQSRFAKRGRARSAAKGRPRAGALAHEGPARVAAFGEGAEWEAGVGKRPATTRHDPGVFYFFVFAHGHYEEGESGQHGRERGGGGVMWRERGAWVVKRTSLKPRISRLPPLVACCRLLPPLIFRCVFFPPAREGKGGHAVAERLGKRTGFISLGNAWHGLFWRVLFFYGPVGRIGPIWLRVRRGAGQKVRWAAGSHGLWA